MTEFTHVITSENEPKYQFFHSGKEYLIYTLVDEDLDVSRICLAVPKEGVNGFTANNVMAEYATPSILAKNGGTKAFMTNVFLPKVNTYLSEQGEPIDDEVFPIDKSVLVQFNWIIENTISYVNGKIVISDF